MRSMSKWMVTGLIGLLASTNGFGAVKPTEKTLALPVVWTEAGAQERLKATRVAELDADRLLAERIYGVLLSSASDVSKFVMESDQITGALDQLVKGIKTTEEPEYLDDGRVQLVRAVKLRQVLETISREITQNKVLGQWITVKEVEDVSRENLDTVIDVMGNGALPGSKGLLRIQAKRAAEMDAYRKLAERVLGVKLTVKTTVKDFVLESEEIRARLISQVLKGAKPAKIEYAEDDSCEVTMELKLADIFMVVKKSVQGNTEIEEVSRKYETTVLTEKGYGAPAAAAQQDQVSAATQSAEPEVREIETVVKRLVGSGVVIE